MSKVNVGAEYKIIPRNRNHSISGTNIKITRPMVRIKMLQNRHQNVPYLSRTIPKKNVAKFIETFDRIPAVLKFLSLINLIFTLLSTHENMASLSGQFKVIFDNI